MVWIIPMEQMPNILSRFDLWGTEYATDWPPISQNKLQGFERAPERLTRSRTLRSKLSKDLLFEAYVDWVMKKVAKDFGFERFIDFYDVPKVRQNQRSSEELRVLQSFLYWV